jgi:hypothetical protein
MKREENDERKERGDKQRLRFLFLTCLFQAAIDAMKET